MLRFRKADEGWQMESRETEHFACDATSLVADDQSLSKIQCVLMEKFKVVDSQETTRPTIEEAKQIFQEITPLLPTVAGPLVDCNEKGCMYSDNLWPDEKFSPLGKLSDWIVNYYKQQNQEPRKFFTISAWRAILSPWELLTLKKLKTSQVLADDCEITRYITYVPEELEQVLEKLGSSGITFDLDAKSAWNCLVENLLERKLKLNESQVYAFEIVDQISSYFVFINWLRSASAINSVFGKSFFRLIHGYNFEYTKWLMKEEDKEAGFLDKVPDLFLCNCHSVHYDGDFDLHRNMMEHAMMSKLVVFPTYFQVSCFLPPLSKIWQMRDDFKSYSWFLHSKQWDSVLQSLLKDSSVVYGKDFDFALEKKWPEKEFGTILFEIMEPTKPDQIASIKSLIESLRPALLEWKQVVGDRIGSISRIKGEIELQLGLVPAPNVDLSE